ncbi:MAG: energy transducer TonB [Steroidobacteraceae bacterium]
MSAYTQHDAQFFSRRALIFVIALGVQVIGFWALEAGLAQRVMRIISAPIQTDIVQQVEKHDTPPPPPPPKMERPPVEIPPPEVSINVPVEPTSTAITRVTTRHIVAPPPRPARRAVIVGASVDMQHSPSTDDYYPPVSRRLNEQGTTIVHMCASPEGRPATAPQVQRSSGSVRLDEAAVKWASHARFHPETSDGRAVQSCLSFRVKFELTDD